MSTTTRKSSKKPADNAAKSEALRTFATRLAEFQRVYNSKGSVGAKLTDRTVSAAKVVMTHMTGVPTDTVAALDVITASVNGNKPSGTRKQAVASGDDSY